MRENQQMYGSELMMTLFWNIPWNSGFGEYDKFTSLVSRSRIFRSRSPSRIFRWSLGLGLGFFHKVSVLKLQPRLGLGCYSLDYITDWGLKIRSRDQLLKTSSFFEW